MTDVRKSVQWSLKCVLLAELSSPLCHFPAFTLDILKVDNLQGKKMNASWLINTPPVDIARGIIRQR